MSRRFARTTFATAVGFFCAAAVGALGDPALAEPAQARVAEAAAAYEAGRAPEAVTILSAIADEAGVSPDLYYDLGLSQLAAGETGPAILSFERARWLAPADPGIGAALAVAREKAGLPSPPATAWLRARNLLGPDSWANLGGLALALACAGAALWLLAPARFIRKPGIRWSLRVGTVAATAAVLVAILACASLATETSRAIALQGEVTLRVSPFEGAEARGKLTAGEPVRIEERHGGFVRVRTGDGRSGWAPTREVGQVVAG